MIYEFKEREDLNEEITRLARWETNKKAESDFDRLGIRWI